LTKRPGATPERNGDSTMTVQAQSDLVFAIGLLTLTVLPIVAIAIALVCKSRITFSYARLPEPST